MSQKRKHNIDSSEDLDKLSNKKKKEFDYSKYICPISRAIFSDPVVASDGHIYERDCIEEWLSSNNTSPITREPITKNVISLLFMKNDVDNILAAHPELKELQYDIRRVYGQNKTQFEKVLKDRIFNRLLYFTDIVLTDIIHVRNIGFKSDNYCDTFMLLCYLINFDISDDIMCHIIDNSIDLECPFTDEVISVIPNENNKDNYYLTPVTYIIKNCSKKVIMCLMSKNINFDYQDKDGNSLLMLLLTDSKNCDVDIVRSMLLANVNPNICNNDGITPLICACLRNDIDIDIVKLLVQNGANVNYIAKNKIPLIAIATVWSNYNIIEFLVKSGANLNVTINTKKLSEYIYAQRKHNITDIQKFIELVSSNTRNNYNSEIEKIIIDIENFDNYDNTMVQILHQNDEYEQCLLFDVNFIKSRPEELIMASKLDVEDKLKLLKINEYV